MRLVKLFLLVLLSFAVLEVARGQKLTNTKEESNLSLQGTTIGGNKITSAENSATSSKPILSLVLPLKLKGKNTKQWSDRKKTIEMIREKLMKTLLENGEVKHVNSRGITSEETVNRNHMESKQDEVWALLDEIMKRKNFLRKEIEEFYRRGLPKHRKRYEPEGSEQIDGNSEDYSEENLSDEGKESESEELPERMTFLKRHRKGKSKRNYKGAAVPILETSSSERSQKISKFKFPKTEKYPEEAGTALEDISNEETNNKRNQLRNKNMQLSKLFVQQMKEICDMESKSRKAKRIKRHYESQIPLPYEISKESENVESVEKTQKRNSKKRLAIKKKFYIIDKDPMGFHYYFKPNQKRNPSPGKVYPAVELSKNKFSKKKNKKRPQQLKKKRVHKKKRRYEKDEMEGILIKQVEESHVNNPNNSVHLENFVLPQSTQLQAKYLYKNKKDLNQNTHDRSISSSEFVDFTDFDSREKFKLPDNRNSKENEPVHQQILKNNQSSEDNYTCAPLEPASKSDMTTNNQKTNDTEKAEFYPKNNISNCIRDNGYNGKLNSSQLKHSIEDVQSLEVSTINLDESPKVRVPRSYRSNHYRTRMDCGDCSELCSSECGRNKYEPEDESTNWEELNMYISLLKKLFEEDPLQDTTTTESPTTTTESSTTTTTDSTTEKDTESIATTTAPSTTCVVVTPGKMKPLFAGVTEINQVTPREQDTTVPSEEPPVCCTDANQPTEKNEQSLLFKGAKGFWLPLKLVQNTDGRFNIQLDLKHICSRCTKQRQKRKRKQHRRISNESH